MFEATVSKFVKEVGKESLIPVPSLDEANRCRPFQVVVKKNRRWFWQSAKYEPSPFQLHQLLVSQNAFDDVTVSTRKLATYNKTYEFDVKGKTGAKLVSVVDLEVGGSDTISVESKFGEITKFEVDQPAFMGKVAERRVDVKHEFVEQVRGDARRTLCVVVGAAQLAEDGTVHMHIDKEGDVEEDASAISKKVSGEEADVSVGDKSDKDLVIPAGTPLAFNLCELLVKADGSLELMVEENSLGGFEDTGDSVDGPEVEAILEGLSLQEQFEAVKGLEEQEKLALTSSILNICTTPVDVETLLKLLKDGQRSATQTPTKTGTLQVKGEFADAQLVLRAAGFVVEDNGNMTYPTEARPLLDAIRSVFEALMELDDDSTVALSKVPTEQAPAVMGVLAAAIEETPITINDNNATAIYLTKNAAQDFITTLGFQVDHTAKVITTLDNHAEIEGAYRAVYALLWVEPKPPHGSSFKCNIL